MESGHAARYSNTLEDIKQQEVAHGEWDTVKSVLHAVPGYVFVLQPESYALLYANEKYLREFPPGEEVETIYDRICACMASYQRYMQEIASGKTRYLEFQMKNRKWIGVQCSSIRLSGGQLLYLFCAQDVTTARKNEEYVQHTAYMDQLTGLPNRYRNDIDLHYFIHQAQMEQTKGYVLLIDMDDFKIINDGYGHEYGDALLLEFAEYLKDIKGERNAVFRFSGDEFVIIVDPSNADRIQELIDTLHERAEQPWVVKGKTFYCTISIGVVAYPDGQIDVRNIMKNAGIAMYEAKRNGKNNHKYYHRNMHYDPIERAEMDRLLRECIAKDFEGFEMYYQPYVEMKEERVMGAEALMRWTPPGKHSSVSPEKFIPLAEYLGLIVPLGEYALREAACLLRHINDSGWEHFMLSANVSMRQLQQKNILARIDAVLQQTGVNAKNLVLEITEGLAITELDRLRMLCNELHAKGIQLALDDFGTGYSSLGNLRDIPIDIIKIDRSFIQNITNDAYFHSFIQLITDFGHSVGKHICIEGVETQSQLNYCRVARVDSIQGYYYYQPMKKDALMQLMQIKSPAI